MHAGPSSGAVDAGYAQAWPRSESLIGVGGAASFGVPLADHLFLGDDATLTIIRGQDILSARPLPRNEPLPSVLGWDVLHRFRITLAWTDREIGLQHRPDTAP